MADTKTHNWKTGDEFLFTESPFSSGKVPKNVHTLGEAKYISNEYFEVAYKGNNTITVSTRWIKKVDE
jgi:hypothetical protein